MIDPNEKDGPRDERFRGMHVSGLNLVAHSDDIGLPGRDSFFGYGGGMRGPRSMQRPHDGAVKQGQGSRRLQRGGMV